MNKESFNSLSIEDQVEYINSEILLDSLTNVCKSIGIGRSTVSDRFKKFGYIYSKSAKQYILNNTCPTSVNNGCPTDVIELNELNNTCPTSVNDTVAEVIELSNEDIKHNLLSLANDYKDIVKMLEEYRRNTSVIKQQIVIDLPETESIVKNLRVNKKAMEDFDKFCLENKQYRKVDLLSQALINFMKQHR